MPGEKYRRSGRVKAVEAEYRAARVAADRLLAGVEAGLPLPAATDLKAVRAMATGLEATYLIRLFAEFENGLRAIWEDYYRRPSQPGAEQLVDAVPTRAGVPEEFTLSVHGTREYRNSLVHDRGDPPPAVRLPDARHALCAFLSRLPERW